MRAVLTPYLASVLGVCGALTLASCDLEPLDAEPAEGPGGGGGIIEASLGFEPPRCHGTGLLELSGMWAFYFETRSTVRGARKSGQEEIVARYGFAAVCQDQRDVAAMMLTCSLVQTPIRDASGDCAAHVPADGLLDVLAAPVVVGGLDVDQPGASFFLEGWTEIWGVETGAKFPDEPDSIETSLPEGLDDTDEDGEPAVTLRGTGEVPTEAWAARATSADFALVALDSARYGGQTRSATRQSVVGGPAQRLLSGREREGMAGDAFWIRADGRLGGPDADANGDGVWTCDELRALIGTSLPPIPELDCAD